MGFKSLKKYLKPETFLILFLMVSSGYLRFKNLGYSDYIGDEFKAIANLKEGQSLWNFLLLQRKGPMQFLVSYIPYIFTQNFENELAERIPFALASVSSVVVFYLLVKKLTKSITVSFFSTFLFMVSGFIVGFGRIVQYQNLNLLFSLLCLYFYSNLISKQKHLIRSTLIGTLFWCLSIYSHWDAIFIIPPVIWLFSKFLLNKDFSKKYKIRIVIYNLLLGCIVILPFMIPYVLFHSSYDPSIDYFSRRISLGQSDRSLYKLYIDIYNPFLTFWLLVVVGFIGVSKIRKNYMFFVWFLFNFALFEIFARKPGTHIYNFLIPVFIMCGFGFEFILDFFFKFLKSKLLGYFVLVVSLLSLAFLYYQSYILFVDHEKEYPWEQKYVLKTDLKCSKINGFCEKIENNLNLKTEKYYYDYKGQKLPLFGFPHKRYWKYINDYVNEQNARDGVSLGYSTNEDPAISSGYMDAEYKTVGSFYFIGIKKPTNFVEDSSPPGSSKELLEVISSEDGKTQKAKIYRVYMSEK